MQDKHIRVDKFTLFPNSRMGGIIIATRGMFAKKALNMATGTQNLSRTQTMLPSVRLGVLPSLVVDFFGALKSTEATYSKPPDISMPVYWDIKLMSHIK